jgi:hypothetical protein
VTLRDRSQTPPSLPLGLEPIQLCLGTARVMSKQSVKHIMIKFLLGENILAAEIHHRPQQQYGGRVSLTDSCVLSGVLQRGQSARGE